MKCRITDKVDLRESFSVSITEDRQTNGGFFVIPNLGGAAKWKVARKAK